jgi:hypothetical protein
VVAHLPGVIAKPGGALDVVLGFDGVEVGGQRRLGVDDHTLATGQPHHQVGPEAAVLRGQGDLLEKVGVLDHPRQLDDLAQLDFSPVAAHVRLTEGLDELAGFALQRRQA